jgi:hypothetical protein
VLGGVRVHGVPQRDATGTIAGLVVTDDTPAKPLRRATVSLLSADLRVPLSTITDDRGAFAFAAVAPGHYSVVASKAAYVGAFYGSTRAGRGPGTPIAVIAGSRVADLRLTLLRGGVIAGTLKLPSGEPALNMAVTAVEVETVGGVRRLRLTGARTTTDDRGQYRVFGLPPGEYLVQAQPSGLLSGALTNANDAPQTTPAEVSWAQQQARGQSAPGATPATSDPPRGRTMNYATVFFPGTADPSSAALVDVGAGDERRGVDFALALVSTARISGVVVAPGGQPMSNVPVSLVVRDDGLRLSSLLTPRAAVRSAADGAFTVPAVPPGRYLLVARAPAGANATPSVDLWSQQEIVVDGRDQSNLKVSMEPGMSVSGRVVFDAATHTPPAGDDLARARVTLVPATSSAAGAVTAGASSASSAVAPDGTFTIAGLPPDAYRVSLSMPGMRTSFSAAGDLWTLRSITRGGADFFDRPVEVRPRESVADVVVRVTDRPAEISGRLLDRANRPAPGYPIVVFPADRQAWVAGSRRIAIARPSTDGTFRVIGLPPGSYFLCALASVDPSELDDPSFLEQLAASSLRVTLGEGAKVVQEFRMGGG